jgi:hypothetical protein
MARCARHIWTSCDWIWKVWAEFLILLELHCRIRTVDAARMWPGLLSSVQGATPVHRCSSRPIHLLRRLPALSRQLAKTVTEARRECRAWRLRIPKKCWRYVFMDTPYTVGSSPGSRVEGAPNLAERTIISVLRVSWVWDFVRVISLWNGSVLIYY